MQEAFKGPRTRDADYDSKLEEMKSMEKNLNGLKTTLSNFINYTSGYKSFCFEFVATIKSNYEKHLVFGGLGNDIAECHQQIQKNYDEMAAGMNGVCLGVNEWSTVFNQAKVKFDKFRHKLN